MAPSCEYIDLKKSPEVVCCKFQAESKFSCGKKKRKQIKKCFQFSDCKDNLPLGVKAMLLNPCLCTQVISLDFQISSKNISSNGNSWVLSISRYTLQYRCLTIGQISLKRKWPIFLPFLTVKL